jgi:cysteine-rich repeat protein
MAPGQPVNVSSLTISKVGTVYWLLIRAESWSLLAMKAVASLLLFCGLALAADYCNNFDPGVEACTSDDNCTLTTVDSCVVNPDLFLTDCTLMQLCNTTNSSAECPNGATCNAEAGRCTGSYVATSLIADNCSAYLVNGTCTGGFCSNYNPSTKACTNNSDCVVSLLILESNGVPGTYYTLNCGVLTACTTAADCPNGLPCNASGYCSFRDTNATNCTCPYVDYNTSGICRSCGNGVLNTTSEQCDDFNWDNGDGCNENCVCEPIEVVDGLLSTDNTGVCVVGDLLTFTVNFTLGNNYTVATGITCYGSGTEFPGTCLGEECTCFVEVGSADMATAGTTGSTEFTIEVTIGNSGCPANSTTLTHSVTLVRQDCGCSAISECNDTADPADIAAPVVAGGVLCCLIMFGLFVFFRKRHHHYHYVTQ